MNAKHLAQNFEQVMAKSILIAAVFLVWSLVPTGAWAILSTGEPAPSFSLVSGIKERQIEASAAPSLRGAALRQG
jgi:hypothetical protein